MKKVAWLMALWGLMLAPVWAAVSITPQEGNFQVATSAYQATVEADGCLTSLKANEKEMLKSGVDISRGCYFVQGPRMVHAVTQDGPAALAATGEKSSIRYEFLETGMVWTLENKTDQPMWFCMVFDPLVGAVGDGQGALKPFPLTQNCSVTEWFSAGTKLQVEGCGRTWGPWAAQSQVLESCLQPHEKLDWKLSFTPATPQELETLEQVLFPESIPQDVLLASPMEYQVFQRQTADVGSVVVRGSTALDARKVRFRFLGSDRHGKALKGKWMTAPLGLGFGGCTFEKELQLPAGGWYEFELQVVGPGKELLASRKLAHVGVGEVFVGAGQSNSTNSGQFQTQQTSGMVSSFSGEYWQLANDPQPGPHDFTGGGSFWPAFGDAMFARYGVPIGVAVTGHGGTSVLAWQPGSDLFAWMTGRMAQLGVGGFRAVLWHQGETDVHMDTEDFYKLMRRLILRSQRVAGWEFPWFVAKVSYHSPQFPSHETTRSVHQRLWDEGIALEGPDTDVLTGDNRDYDGNGIHFSPKGLKAHGQMWAEKVSPYLDKALAAGQK